MQKRGGVPGNFTEKVIFTYSIEHLLKKDKIRFYYALKGRDGKSGVAKEYGIEQLGRAVLILPPKFSSQFESFLTLWKCPFEKREVFLKK